MGTNLCDKEHVDLEIRTLHCFFIMYIYCHKGCAKDKGKAQHKKASSLCNSAQVSLRGLDDSSALENRLQPAGAGPRHVGAAGKTSAPSVDLCLKGSHCPSSLDAIVRVIKCSQTGARAFCTLRVGFVLLTCRKYLVLGWINLLKRGSFNWGGISTMGLNRESRSFLTTC